MNRLIEENYVSELKCGTNFSYIVNDKNSFMPTEYKVLMGQTEGGFLKCMKMHFNGKTQLYYLTGKNVSFASVLPKLNFNSFVTILSNIFGNIIEAKDNGFLSCKNIDISLEHIYIDMATYKVKFAYLPIRNSLYSDIASFENELRACMIKLLSELPNLSSTKALDLLSKLQDDSISLEEIYSILKQNTSGNKVIHNDKMNQKVMPQRQVNTKPYVDSSGKVKLVALNSNERIELIIDKPKYIIGKKQSLVDGAVSFNRMISRVHCQIINKLDKYYIEDLNSANGTFVNRVRLQPNVPCEIRNGDMIRLANSDFQIVIP